MLKLGLTLMAGLVLLVLGVSLVNSAGLRRGAGGGFAPPPAISSIAFSGPAILYNNTHGTANTGDTQFSTWGDDGKTYIMWNDGSLGGGLYTHLALNTLSGPPFDGTSNLAIVPPNTLANWGKQNDTLPAGTSFKSAGLICLPKSLTTSGTGANLYLMTRQFDDATYQFFKDYYLIKSADYGVTWVPAAPTPANTPYPTPMFPGTQGPSGFYQYGQCYNGAGPHKSGQYVYMNVWNFHNGQNATVSDQLWLARVPLNKIDAQTASDWQFYSSSGCAGGDGMNDACWVPSLTSTSPAPTPIIDGHTYTGFTYPVSVYDGEGVQWLPRYQQYVMLGTSQPSAGPYVVSFFASLTPWGPWTVYGQSASPDPVLEGWHNVIQASMANGGQTFTVAASGKPGTSNYQLFLRPVQVTP